MIETAEKRRKKLIKIPWIIEPVQTQVLVWQWFCAVKGYKLVLVMPESMSVNAENSCLLMALNLF